jgi:hypothetical protein
MSLSYVPDFKTDGVIPAVAVAMLDGTKGEVAELLSARLWVESGEDYIVNAYLEHNPSDEEMETVREARRLAGSKGGRRKAERVASATAHATATGVASASQALQQTPTKNVPDIESESDRESDTTPSGVGTHASPPPEARVRRRDVHDFAGAPADAAQAALSAACVAAGGTPKPRGGYPTQQAWAQVACDAAELAEKLSLPVANVLDLSARGFVAARGPGGNPVWWAERFGDYLEAGRKPPARKAGHMHPLPPVDSYKPTTDEELDAMFGPETAA